MKIYTRTGDEGETGLFGGPRVSKDHARIEAYGTVDELGAVLGQARAQNADPEIDQVLLKIQHRLFDLGAELATPEPTKVGIPRVADVMVDELEQWIDGFERELVPLKSFILAGGTAAASSLHLARVVCRRAERRVVTLQRLPEGGEPVSPAIVVYLNRLSDLLFVLSRVANSRAGSPDVAWQKYTP